MSKEYLFFISLLIILYLAGITKGNEELKKERIFSTLKLILNSIQSNITRDSFSLNYPKYQIHFSDFKITNPLERDIKIKIIYSNIFSIQDLIVTFIYNNNIIFDDNNHAKLEDLDKIFEIKFKDIVFFQNNNFLFLNNTIVDSILIPKKTKISCLKYFKDFNEGIINPIFSETNEYYNLNVILTKIFDEMFKDRILNIFENINLYYYDLNKILNNSKIINFIYSDIFYPYNSKYVIINKIELNKEKIIFESNILYVRYLKFIGSFYFYNGDFIEFNAYLKENVEMYLLKNMISFTNKYRPFKVKIIDKSFIDDEYYYEYAFNNEFLYLLDNNCKKYYEELDK